MFLTGAGAGIRNSSRNSEGSGWGVGFFFFFNWKFSCKLTNLSRGKIPRGPGAGAMAGQKEKNMVTLVKTATAPVGLLGLTQHRENSGELTKPGEM